MDAATNCAFSPRPTAVDALNQKPQWPSCALAICLIIRNISHGRYITERRPILERAKNGGAAGAHALYRTAHPFFGKVRLCYDDLDHPGFVREDRNPFASLDLSLPKAVAIVWPRAAVDAFVTLADSLVQPSMGYAIWPSMTFRTGRRAWHAEPDVAAQ